MKYLYFLRHAKSSWRDGDLSDLERPLNDRGVSDVALISKHLSKKKLKVDLVISSHSKRTKRTAELLCKHMKWDKSIIEYNERLYHAFYYDVMEILASTNKKVDKLMLVGHNPTITNFVNKFSEEYISNVPTAGLITVKAKIDKWKDLSRQNSTLEDFIFPKMFK